MNYEHWIRHFEVNRSHRPEPEWDAPMSLPEQKRAALAKSLAEYQLGDGGGECRLIGFDAEKARGVHPDAAKVIDLWFREEAEHSRLLGCGLRRIGGVFLTSTFGFRWFNRIRCWFGAQFEMLVLLVVEIVSTGYYRLIQRHCDDAPIAAMCGLILRDESGHIVFHRDRLGSKNADWSRGWRASAIRALGLGCMSFLWPSHGKWLSVIGASFRELREIVRSETDLFLASVANYRAKEILKESRIPSVSRTQTMKTETTKTQEAAA
jgi:hypothetical protein